MKQDLMLMFCKLRSL